MDAKALWARKEAADGMNACLHDGRKSILVSSRQRGVCVKSLHKKLAAYLLCPLMCVVGALYEVAFLHKPPRPDKPLFRSSSLVWKGCMAQ